MARLPSRVAAATALLSSLGMVAMPASAAQINAPSRAVAPAASAQGWSIDDETAHRHRWYGRGYRGYGGYGWRRHRGADAGDVLAGVLIIGGIAAIATAASRDRDRRRVETDRNGYPYRNYPNRGTYRDRDGGYRDGDDRGGYGDTDSRGLGNAADMCASEASRSQQVDKVESVNRTGDGWRVTGTLRNGRGFSCSIDNNGQLRGIDMDGQASAGGGQWDDDAYARARAGEDGEPDA